MEYRIVHSFPESYRVEKKVWYGWKKKKFQWADAVFSDTGKTIPHKYHSYSEAERDIEDMRRDGSHALPIKERQ